MACHGPHQPPRKVLANPKAISPDAVDTFQPRLIPKNNIAVITRVSTWFPLRTILIGSV